MVLVLLMITTFIDYIINDLQWAVRRNEMKFQQIPLVTLMVRNLVLEVFRIPIEHNEENKCVL